MSVADVISAVRAGPSGPHVGAFFDLDGTLVEGYTAGAFYTERIRRGEIGAGEFLRTLWTAVDGALGGDPARIGDVSIAGLKGRAEDTIAELGERLFVQRIAGTIRPEARDLVRAHLAMGHTVAISSAATRFQIEPLARDLGIPNVLCTQVKVVDGLLTGELAGPMLWGEPKAAAVRRFARENEVDLRSSHGYANGAEDVPFLASVGTANALNPHPALADAAKTQGWRVLNLREPHKPGLRSWVGTAAALTGFNLGLGLGVALGAVNRDARMGRNYGIPAACDAALALGGVKLDVVGEENLWRARPAVFVANHQSSLDALVVGALLRKDFTAVAKKEARYDPRAMIGGMLLDPAFIDRSDPASAKDDLDLLSERIRGGTSVVLFPEGTRAPTSTLGRFKKGAFHMAIQAGVPMVPVVLRNTGELMWRSSKLVNPGTVQVAVLDPVSTDDWSTRTLDVHVKQVRDLFAQALENWPGGE